MDLGAGMNTLQFLIRDRDGKFILAFDSVLDAEGIQVINTPPRAPRANAICERVVGTLRRDLLDRILILGPGDLPRVLAEYPIHYKGRTRAWRRGLRTPILQSLLRSTASPARGSDEDLPSAPHQRIRGCTDVDVPLRIYASCLEGQDEIATRRIVEALA
jgi:hypothetical protein